MLSKTVLLSAPPVLEKDERAALAITTIHSKSYPGGCIIVRLHITGDDFSVICKIRCGAENNSRREVVIDTSHSGVTVFEIKRFWTVSMLGLFSLPANISSKKYVLILPPPVKPANTLALQQGTRLQPKPGGGFSEEHDMRKYRPGDPVRSIHWKLSAKLDSLIIREPLVPPPHSRLIQIARWNNAHERDLILGRLRWVCKYMLKWQMPFYVKFADDSTVAEVNDEKDLVDFLCRVLGDKAKVSNFTPSRFSWIFRIEP